MGLENVDDMLSALPEEIVSHILSLMPTKFAVRTSILSKRWRRSWMFVTNLDFDDDHVRSIFNNPLKPGYDSMVCIMESARNVDHTLEFERFVDCVLKSCKSSQVNLFRLHLTKTLVPRSYVSKWIDKAVCLNVHELDIQLMDPDLPLSLFTCKTLTKLRLHSIPDDLTSWEFPCGVSLPCLKTLDIRVPNNPSISALKLIRGCPILETLSLEVVIQWGVREEYIFNIPTLKRLSLTILVVVYTNNFVLDLPNLEYLFVGGVLCSHFVMKDISSLVEAFVSFSYSSFIHSWDDLLKGLHGVKLLSVELKRFPHSGLISQFLELSPRLKHLCIENFDNQEKPKESSWMEPKFVPACMITTLTTIKFSKCKGWKSDMKFMEYMLENAEVLKNVTIIWGNLHIEDEKRLCAQLLKVPRASRNCEIQFLGKYSLPNLPVDK